MRSSRRTQSRSGIQLQALVKAWHMGPAGRIHVPTAANVMVHVKYARRLSSRMQRQVAARRKNAAKTTATHASGGLVGSWLDEVTYGLSVSDGDNGILVMATSWYGLLLEKEEATRFVGTMGRAVTLNCVTQAKGILVKKRSEVPFTERLVTAVKRRQSPCSYAPQHLYVKSKSRARRVPTRVRWLKRGDRFRLTGGR